MVLAEETHDAVVIGGGVGGLTSALYLSRAGLHPLVVTGNEPGGALAQSPLVQNWPGEIGIRGGELVERIREQAEESGAAFVAGDVIKVDFSSRPFKITIKDSLAPDKLRVIHAKASIIATGATPRMLGVPGEKTYWLKGVHNCAVCDGNFYKDQNVFIVGGGDGAITEAAYLSKLAKTVTLVVRKDSLKSIESDRKKQLLATPNIAILYNTTVQKISGDAQKMTAIVLKNSATGEEKTLPADALFLAIGSVPNTSIFKGQLELDESGYIVLQDDAQTSVPGVFAIGDVSDSKYRQAVTAAGDGAKAALQAQEALSSSTVASTPPPPQKTPPATTDVITIRSMDQFENEVLRSNIPVVVDFYADWCGPCKVLEPHIRGWSKRFEGKVKFAKVNIDHLGKLAQRYSVRAVPTVLYFDVGGVLVDTRTGMPEISGLIDKIDVFSTSQ